MDKTLESHGIKAKPAEWSAKEKLNQKRETTLKGKTVWFA
jgi:hypothetical protein